MNEKVSLIVPFYNVELYIEKCLKSIIEQSYKNIEVIIVDDGSKDGSKKIAEKFQLKDSRLRIVSKENGGLSSARNFGLQYATGNYVAFIDSDDYLSKCYVETLVSAFDENTDIVIGDYVIFNQQTGRSYRHNNPLEKKEYIGDTESLVWSIITGSLPVMSVWKNLYRTSFLKDNEIVFISEREVYAEDQLFNIEAYSKAKCIKVLPEIVYYHLTVSNSLSQGYRPNMLYMIKNLYLQSSKKLNEAYGETLRNEYKKYLPSYIGMALFHLTKCDFGCAIKNVKQVINDELNSEAYRISSYKGYSRYIILYKLSRLNNPLLVVLSAKLMRLSSPIYRRLNRREEYIENNP